MSYTPNYDPSAPLAKIPPDDAMDGYNSTFLAPVIVGLQGIDPVPGDTGGGTSNYNALTNKPQINGVVISGNMTPADLGLTSNTPYTHTQTAPASAWNIPHNLGRKFVDGV
jgi:hypothetical protein